MSTILITGANRGIGLELTRRYAEAGHTVLACCRSAGEALTELAKKQPKVRVCPVEIAKPESVAALKKSLGDQPIDILINNAGTQGPQPQNQSLEEMDFDGWAETFAVNTMAPLRLLQTFHSNLRAAAHPKVVTITSQMGALSLDMTMMYAYCASKAAVNKVMRLASVELAREGIAVGLIHPGWVRTEMGGAGAALSVEESVDGVLRVIDSLDLENTGFFRKWNGETHAW